MKSSCAIHYSLEECHHKLSKQNDSFLLHFVFDLSKHMLRFPIYRDFIPVYLKWEFNDWALFLEGGIAFLGFRKK